MLACSVGDTMTCCCVQTGQGLSEAGSLLQAPPPAAPTEAPDAHPRACAPPRAPRV